MTQRIILHNAKFKLPFFDVFCFPFMKLHYSFIILNLFQVFANDAQRI